jgi:type II secretory ATPase GspE/PulE/Tfp pilus assembly ATPase PilB-like protein
VRFIGKGTDEREEDPSRVARAQRSKGYQTALELVYDAIEGRATDIHMEPSREEMAVRFRVDSMLHPHQTLDRAMGESVLNIFKVLAALDITEKRKPQDGSFSAEVEGRGVDFRVATAGSVAGEKLVMRILDQSKHLGDLSQLGLSADMQSKLKEIIDQPHGMILTCGPTGAGKSSTLYACLGEIDRYQRNVITLENPVEYQLHNVTQIEVNPKAGKTFASELRSVLRQDPDVIMVGEIRDAETAEIACQAAQTGHMVFSTLHANDTVTAIGRLIDLNIQPFLLANALTALLSQRLVRLLCPKCKVRFRPSEDVLRRYKLHPDKVRFLYRAPEENEREVGGDGEPVLCKACGNTGYRGRTGVFELLVVTDDIREMIRTNPNLLAIKQAAARAGLVTLAEDALRKVLEGKTSLQELQRVAKA